MKKKAVLGCTVQAAAGHPDTVESARVGRRGIRGFVGFVDVEIAMNFVEIAAGDGLVARELKKRRATIRGVRSMSLIFRWH